VFLSQDSLPTYQILLYNGVMANSSRKRTAKPKSTPKTTNKSTTPSKPEKLSKINKLKSTLLDKPAYSRRPRTIAPTPSVRKITLDSVNYLWERRRLFVGITLVYGALDLVLVQGLSADVNVSSLKSQLASSFTGHAATFYSTLTIFGTFLSKAASGSASNGGIYEFFLILVASMAVIWALRRSQADDFETVRVRDAYYKGMFPLVPVLIVLMFVGLQTIPLIIGSSVFGLALNNEIARGLIEYIIFGAIFAALALCSLYMITASVIGLYVVTTPDMTPRAALKEARSLINHRRWTVFRKMLCLPVMILVIMAVIMLPVILFLAPLAPWIFFLLVIFSLPVIHTYMFTLYHGLLAEQPVSLSQGE
jgi:hypothetical protein